MKLISDFEQSFINDLSDFTKEFAETTLDSVIDNPILQNIPVVQGLIALYKTGVGIRERHNLKKILKFLNSLSSISFEERQAFIGKLNSENAKEEIFEKLLLILDRLDEEEKALILGNLFKLYVLEVITRNQFLRLSSIVEKAFLNDLIVFHKAVNIHEEMRGYYREVHNAFSKYEVKLSLYNLGLLKTLIKTKENPDHLYRDKYENTVKYETSNLGFTLAACMYYRDSQISNIKNFVNIYR